jgi:DtxR family Mn-dependent transcriptional regulator
VNVAEYQTREFHPAFEEYCEAIWELKEDEVEVIQARVAERLHVSRPAVSEMIKRMQNEGFVALDGTTINLTNAGRNLAEQVVRRHRLAERLLTDVLGLPWADAHVEAGKWEHVISEPVERAINRVLDNPTTCPHGNPIPGSKYAPPETVPLANLPVGSKFTVTRIPEELEFTPGLLEFLEEASVQPGRSGAVTATSPDGTTTVEIDGQHVGIGAFASARILVTTESAAVTQPQPAGDTVAPV